MDYNKQAIYEMQNEGKKIKCFAEDLINISI